MVSRGETNLSMISGFHAAHARLRYSKPNFLSGGALAVQDSMICISRRWSGQLATITRMHLSALEEITWILTTTTRTSCSHHSSASGLN